MDGPLKTRVDYKTLWFLDYLILQQLVDILTQQVSSPDNLIEDDNTADEDYLLI